MQITVQQGDTLWSLAARHLGDPLKWRVLWEANRDVIEREQRRYPEARAGMDGPDWIFPGTVIRI